MDTEAFAAVREPRWERLRELAAKRHLTGAETDELVRLYQATATDLSQVRTLSPDPYITGRLSSLLNSARGRITGTRELSWATVRRVVAVTIPAALYRVRWWTTAVMAAFLVVGTIVGFHVANSPDVIAGLGSPVQLDQYANEAFEAYYSSQPAPDFMAFVWTNNAWIAVQCIAAGITGIFPAYVLWANAASIGEAGAIMHVYGELSVFFSLILPHGLLELTAIFIAGAAGLRLFWTLVNPGPRSRGVALAQEGRLTVTLVGALVIIMLIAGIIEAFVTPSDLAWWLKILIGAVALAALWAYTLIPGRRAYRSGLAHQAEEDVAGYRAAEAGS